MTDVQIPAITIQREYGAGSRTIAQLISEKLNIPWYDKDFIKKTAENCGLSIKQIEKDSEEMNDSEKIFDTLLGNSATMYDKVFYAQREVILKLAKTPCIIIGRASEAICKEAGIHTLNIFLFTDMKHAVDHTKDLHENGKMPIEKYIQKRTKARANFYKTYTGKCFSDPHNYDLCLNTAIGYKKCANIIIEYVNNSIHMQD